MARKTYIPTFVRLLKRLCVYYTRYREVIRSESASDVDALLDEFEEFCSALLEKMTIPSAP